MISEYTLCARRFGAFLLVKGSTLAGYLRRRDAPLPAGIKRERVEPLHVVCGWGYAEYIC